MPFEENAILTSMINKITPHNPIGSLKWAIYDTAAKELLSSGEKTLQISDVKIEPVEDFFDKQIDLDGFFTFSLADAADILETPDCNGFGLSGHHAGYKSFAWEWFEVDKFGHANKLQESGELCFDTKPTPNGTEIHRMEFLTDVSIRISRMDGKVSTGPAWRINIFKGSVICWPTLVDGDVQCL